MNGYFQQENKNIGDNMSIKEVVKKFLCKGCESAKLKCLGCATKLDTDFCTQQIISEIVAELEKLPMEIMQTEVNKFGIVLSKDKIIETIRKMGD